MGRDPLGYYDRAGLPISLAEWSRLMTIMDYKRVALDHVGSLEISTIWLGLDHGYWSKQPLIFETMVFGGSKDQEICERYSTEELALAGHREIVTLIRATESMSDAEE